MSTVPPVGSSTSQDATTPKSSVGDLDYNAFLKLLIEQLKNQDPTKPMDSTQFVSQLATFSQVEQAIASNTKLDSLLTASSLSIADSAIGHKVTSADGLVSGTVASVKITSDGPIATLDSGKTLLLGSGIVMQ